jgi:hypothetical protein
MEGESESRRPIRRHLRRSTSFLFFKSRTIELGIRALSSRRARPGMRSKVSVVPMAGAGVTRNVDHKVIAGWATIRPEPSKLT